MKQLVTPYFLSCKRLSLFLETFKSFWECCEDLDLIKYFIVIDDNSSLEDRKEIMDSINGINIPSIFLSKNNMKGQNPSLNMVYDLCKTKYAIGIEDDWKFTRKGHFIRDSIDIMKKHSDIKRVCVDFSSSGKNISDININDIFTIGNEKYFIHRYENKTGWPSFTVRQSIIDIEACFKNIGYFRYGPKDFFYTEPILAEFHHDGFTPTGETDYGVRYCDFGYRTAFFMDTFVTETSKNYASSFILNQSIR